MEIPFTKMHGCGNDFIFIDCLKNDIPDLGAIAGRLCDRRFGIGADQLLTVHPSNIADFKMEIYNADGSQVEMCGNGIRCFAKYVYEHGLTQNKQLEVETLAGIIRPRIVGDLVEVDMGEPILEGRKIPVDADGQIVNRPLVVDGRNYSVTCLSMGNPHCVLYLEDIDALDLEKIGPLFEHHAFFPKRVNTEFIKLLSPNDVNMRVWERGAGETWACGTGASAVAVAGVLGGRTERKLTVHLKGGDLFIEWRDNNRVYMTGAAEEVFQGRVKID
ncbi:MAG TPA: diaminopimelate epimerase [Candidatus Polarisedimenticolaceae bacterium]|nr:diaminopimelate epimerase [Candidatus Polarisedimenticolaceae bacterium]